MYITSSKELSYIVEYKVKVQQQEDFPLATRTAGGKGDIGYEFLDPTHWFLDECKTSQLS